MSSTHLLPQPVRAVNQSLSFRASSASLFLSQNAPNSHTDGTTDLVDMSIAQSLLRTDSLRIPKRRSSFNYVATSHQSGLPAHDDGHSTEARLYHERRLRQVVSSNTWTSSSAEVSEDDGNEDRTSFVEEYNKLATKYCVQKIVPDDCIAVHVDQVVLSAKSGSWIMRKILGRTASVHLSNLKGEKVVRHRRSISEMSLRAKPKKDSLKGKDLIELVRLCGTSPLYLPVEYTASTLAVPTCFRATAQYLVQHAATSRGIFRISGAHSTINALYNHYASQDEEGEVIFGTVRCPTLPEHIQCNVHDVASAFKRFLAGLPGGILGKLWLFDAFLSIYAQLDSKAEAMRTKQSKVRARLMALAITAVAPRHRRELICAVMGLLSMIGRAAEIAPREDEHGRPLPTSDLMGYGALGIVFGPLLVGDLLDGHDLRLASPNGPLVFTQRSPPKSSRNKHKKIKVNKDSNALVQDTDKIRIVNSITEMVITHWRDIVRHMKDLDTKRSAKYNHHPAPEILRTTAPPSPIELFTVQRPCSRDMYRSSICNSDRNRSPTTSLRNAQTQNAPGFIANTTTQQDEKLLIRKRMARPKSILSRNLSGAKSMSVLTPTVEEFPGEERIDQYAQDSDLNMEKKEVGLNRPKCTQDFRTTISSHASLSSLIKDIVITPPEASRTKEFTVVLGKSNPTDSRMKPVNDQNRSTLDQQGFGEREPPEAKTIVDKSCGEEITIREARASSFDDNQKHSKDLRIQSNIISSPGDLECLQNQPESFSRIPAGIVASRLRGITNGNSGPQSSPRLHRAKDTDEMAISEEKYGPTKLSDSSQTFINRYQDPLNRVSQEEDIASLTLLAQIIKSQDDITGLERTQGMDLTKASETSVKFIKTRTESSNSVTSISDLQDERPSPKGLRQKDSTSYMPFTTNTIAPMDIDRWAITPRRSTTEPSMPRRTGGTSVKALAARFGNAEGKAIQTPSPVRTPDSQVWRGSLMEKAIIATYTINDSPVPTTRRIDRLDTSFNSISSPSRMRVRTFSSLNKPSLSNPNLGDEVGPPRWHKLRPMDQNSRHNSELIRVRSSNATPRQFSPNLHRTGDGNASFGLPRMLSEDPLKLQAVEQDVREQAEIDQPTVISKYPCLSPLNLLKSSKSRGEEYSDLSWIEQQPRKQNASILYTQIQCLSKQIGVKTDEADQLRRQLTTRETFSDRTALLQLVKELKRDLSLWRIRAEEAEHRVEILSRISEKEVEEAIEHSTATSMEASRNGL